MRDGVDVDALDALGALGDALDAASRRADDEFDVDLSDDDSFRASMTPRGTGFHRALAMTVRDAPASAAWIATRIGLRAGATFDADAIRAATRGWTCETSGDADGERTSASASASALTCARRMIRTNDADGDDARAPVEFAATAHARYGAPRPGGGFARIEIDDFGAAATLTDGTTRVARARADGIWDVPVGDASAVGRVRATTAAARLAGAACVLRAIRASTRRARTR